MNEKHERIERVRGAYVTDLPALLFDYERLLEREAKSMSELRVDQRVAVDGQHYLVLVGENNQDVMVSEMYPTISNANRARRMIEGATISTSSTITEKGDNTSSDIGVVESDNSENDAA